MAEAFKYINTHYNRQRLHLSLDHLSQKALDVQQQHQKYAIQPTEKEMKYHYIGAAGPVIFFVVTFVLASVLPGYSSHNQMISELGATGTEYANVFNYLGFLPNGVFITIFAMFLYSALKINKLNTMGAILIAIHGTGMFLATWYSCDISCNPVNPSKSQIIHNAIAGIKFPALIMSMFVIGVQLTKSGLSKKFGMYSIFSGAVSLILMGLFASSVETRSHTGELQRLFIGVAYLWLVLLSANSCALFNGKVCSKPLGTSISNTIDSARSRL